MHKLNVEATLFGDNRNLRQFMELKVVHLQRVIDTCERKFIMRRETRWIALIVVRISRFSYVLLGFMLLIVIIALVVR